MDTIMKKTLLLMAMALPFVLISCGDDKDEPVTPEEHEYVDLGLPSGTLWATCNVGANTPEEYGDYFAWGETAPKDYYDFSSYKWCKLESDNTYSCYTKYCAESIFGYNGFTDGKIELDLVDDAAYINWGASWHMPSLEQIQELLNSCSWQWTERNGVNGQLVIGPNGNTIFLPATGYRWNQFLDDVGSNGYYWSRTLCPSYSSSTYFLVINSGNVHWNNTGRILGFAIRAVRVSKK